MTKVSIIIVTYNSEGTIKNCIDSVISSVHKNSYEIIVSDNSENENTKNEISKYYKNLNNLIYFKNVANLGFSKANNLAVKKSKGEFILFLNPDTKIYDQTLDGMIEFITDKKDCGVATCFVELPNGKLDGASHRGFPTPWRSFSHFSNLAKTFPKSKIFGGYSLTYLNMTKAHEIDSAAGSFMLVPKNVGDKIGWWDEDYFFYGEDIDFCYRVKEKGYSVWFEPKYRALHVKGVSSGIKKESKDITKASNETKKLATFHRFKAMEIFYDKHYKDKYPKIINSFVKMGIRLKKSTVF